MDKVEALPGIFLLKEKALWLPDMKAIVIADVHLGYESGLFDEPFYPKIQFEEISERMEGLMRKYRPEHLIIDGDLKHEFSKTPHSEFSEVRDFLDIMGGSKITLVRGNHDNFIAGYLKKRGVEVVQVLETERFLFVHGHEEIRVPDGKIAILGHEHPVFTIRDEIGGKASFPCFLVSKDRIVMPAFGGLGRGSVGSGYLREGMKVYVVHKEGISILSYD